MAKVSWHLHCHPLLVPWALRSFGFCFSGDCDIHLLYFFFFFWQRTAFGLLSCRFRVTLSAWHLYGSADYVIFSNSNRFKLHGYYGLIFYDNLTFYVSLILSFVLKVFNAKEIVSVARIKYSLCEFLHLNLIVDFQPLRLIV